MKIFKSNKFLQTDWFWLLVIFMFSALAFRTLVHYGYFPMHDDLQMMRQLELEKCFMDGQIPCRWVPDMGYGFGFPLFNFYPPLPYLIGQVFRIFQIAFTDVVKILFSLSFVASGAAMYFFAKEMYSLVNKKLSQFAGAVSAIFYIWAPYHAVDVFVRGAMNEDWAMVFFPLILWTSYRLIKSDKKSAKWVIALSLSWLGLFLSHNLMVMIFAPIFTFWCLIFLWLEKKWVKIPQLALSGGLILGLAAFFTIPAFLEQKYVQVNTLISGYYEYIAHFATINQLLFSRFWGYGASVFGPGDGMPFPVGHFHWIFSIVVIGYLLFGYLKNKKFNGFSLSMFFLLIIGWISTFMAHERSTPIWLSIKTISFLQFPWRFLTIPTFSFSFAAGFLVIFLLRFKKLMPYLVAAILVGLVAWNWVFFKIERFGPVTVAEKFSGEAWRIQQTAGIYDYLPKTAEMAPQAQRTKLVEVITGEAKISEESQGTNWAQFKVEVTGTEAELRMGILEFPVWKSYVDGIEVPNYVSKDEKWGRMYIKVPQGSHSVYFRLYNTPIRTVSNYISLATWLGLLAYLLWASKNDKI